MDCWEARRCWCRHAEQPVLQRPPVLLLLDPAQNAQAEQGCRLLCHWCQSMGSRSAPSAPPAVQPQHALQLQDLEQVVGLVMQKQRMGCCDCCWHKTLLLMPAHIWIRIHRLLV